MSEYEMVSAKRRWVPEWLWWLACAFNVVVWFRPLRWVLTEREGGERP